MKLLPWLLALSVVAADAAPRNRAERAAFQRENACPATGAARGACPGWEVDHIIPLCAGGPDHRTNMQWLTRHDHKLKTKRDVARCRAHRSRA